MNCASYLYHFRPLPLFPLSDEEEEEHRYLPEQEVLGQETLEKIDRLLPRIRLFIDEGTKSPPIQILNHAQRVSSYLEIYGMLKQPDMIHLCHTISFIMMSRSRSLIY